MSRSIRPRSIPPITVNGFVAAPGVRLNDRYVLEAKVGQGGMGEVWRAKHLALENDVAIKFLSASFAASTETKRRFLVEAKVTAQLRSRNAVRVFDYGVTSEGQPYLVMELLDGETLAERIKRLGKLDVESTVRILRFAAKALYRAHNIGIIHRDFKPDNIFLVDNEDNEEEVKVVDFGVAKLLGALDDDTPPTPEEIAVMASSLTSVSRTGKLVGTPHYMAPEQVRMSTEQGPAADIWALGVVAFECLTGKCPFAGNNVLAVFAAIQTGRRRLARELVPGLPEEFDLWLSKACALEPGDRFRDAQLASTALATALLVEQRQSMVSEMDFGEVTHSGLQLPPDILRRLAMEDPRRATGDPRVSPSLPVGSRSSTADMRQAMASPTQASGPAPAAAPARSPMVAPPAPEPPPTDVQPLVAPKPALLPPPPEAALAVARVPATEAPLARASVPQSRRNPRWLLPTVAVAAALLGAAIVLAAVAPRMATPVPVVPAASAEPPAPPMSAASAEPPAPPMSAAPSASAARAPVREPRPSPSAAAPASAAKAAAEAASGESAAAGGGAVKEPTSPDPPGKEQPAPSASVPAAIDVKSLGL